MPLQRLPKVSAPDDPLEVEAEQVAQRVVAGQSSAPISSTGPPAANQRADDNDDTVFAWLQRLAVGEEEEVQRVVVGEDEEEIQRVAVGQDEEDDESVQALLQRLPNGSPTGSSGVASALGSPGPGAPIPPAVRTAIEPGLGVELGGVEVHTGPRAERAADDVQARAFTNRNHVFLNRGESPHDVSLMAHEATHVVQQGAAGKSHRSAGTGADEIQRLPAFIADELAGYARHVPGYTLFTVIIGVNPLTGARVERTPINLVEGVMGLVPFGTAIFDKLVDLGVLQDAFAFVERQLSTFDLSLARLERLIQEAWDEMDFVRLDPFDHNLGVLVRKFSGLLEDVRGFAASLVDALVQLIKDAAIGLAEDLLADRPAWALIKKVLGRDPLRDEPVEATTVEILEDFLLLIGKEQELEQMRVRGTLQETADWLDTQLATFQGLLSQLGSLFTAAWEAIQPENLPNLIANLRGLADQAIGFLEGVWSFATTVAAKVLELVKKALLGWLSEFAHEVPGFHLLTVILGRNPFTGERVPRSAENLIRGFITLLPGGNAVYDQLAETGVIGEAAARIEGAMSELGISWEMVVGLFRGIWEGLSIDDLVDPIGAFTRIRDQFGEPISRLFAFIRVVLREILTLVLAVMNFPSDVIGRIVANAMRAYEDIKRNVVGFLINMLAAVKAGFSNFFDNVFDHLLGGLIDWLFRGLRQAGIEPPSELTLETGLDLLLQVLGITTERLWEKLAERIGQERVDQIRGALDRLEGIWTFVTDVQERGVVAIWEYIEGQITNLWDTIIAQVRDWIMEKIISRVTAKLLSMLDPTGVMAVVNSFIAFFNAIQSAVEYMREILDIVDQYVATLAAVARGDIEPGAARLEQGLVSAIPVAIGFLANQVGLGNIGEKITEIVGGLRALVDQALDWLLDQAERLLDALLRTLGLAGPTEERAPDHADEEIDATDHRTVAQRVVGQLEQIRSDSPLDQVREELQQRARQQEEYWSPRLEEGVGLTVSLASQPTDLQDTAIPFTVVVAPNTEEAAGSVEVNEPPQEQRALTPGDKAYVRLAPSEPETHGTFVGTEHIRGSAFAKFELSRYRGGTSVYIRVQDISRYRKNPNPGRAPHTMHISIIVEGREVVSATRQSGDMTQEEYELGFPQNTLATHTEARALLEFSEYLHPDARWELVGEYLPCPACKGKMHRAARSGAVITYEPGGFVAG